MALGYPTPGFPGPPTSLNATAGSGEIDLAWSTPANNGGSAITGYKVYRDTASPATTLVDTIGVTNSYNDTGRTAGVEYFYRVKATNANGDSAFSNEDSATPLAKTVVFLTTTSVSDQSWSVLSDWNSADNTVEVISHAGTAASGNVGTGAPHGGGGGGGGGYAFASNVSLTPGGTATYRLRAAGSGNTDATACWFNGTTLSGSSAGIRGGTNASTTTGGSGASTTNAVGSTVRPGGSGGGGEIALVGGPGARGGGGGGAAGPTGNGGNGVSGSSTGNGGTSDGGTVSGGTGGSSPTAGSSGTQWQTSPARGTGGGGGGKLSSGSAAASGGSFGGGAGGGGANGSATSTSSGGTSRAGLIVIINNVSL